MLDPLSSPISLSIDSKPTTPPAPRRRLLKATDKPDEYTMEWDYSSSSDFMVCARKAENKLVRGRELAKDQSALSFGRLFHKLDELRMREGLTPAVLQRQTELTAGHFIDYPCAPTDHRTFDMMQQVLKVYNERYKNDNWKESVFSFEGEPFVERPFKLELCTIEVNAWVPYSNSLLIDYEKSYCESDQVFIKRIHILYVGRIDLVLLLANHLWVVDNKTTSRGGNEFTEAFRLSLQTRGYAWAVWKITGQLPMGCIVNGVIVRKPTKTGKNLEFNRPTYFYPEESLVEFEQNMKAHSSDFVGNLVRGFWPQTSLSFKSPCPSCDYHDNCALPQHQRAADLASDIYRDVTWNPLLEQ